MRKRNVVRGLLRLGITIVVAVLVSLEASETVGQTSRLADFASRRKGKFNRPLNKPSLPRLAPSLRDLGYKKAPTVGPDVNVSRLNGDQNEGTIAINPANPNNLYVSSNMSGAALFSAFSMDAGATWSYSQTSGTVANGFDTLPQACCDPSAAFDAFGNLFLTYLNASATRVVVALSTDGGRTFATIAQLGAFTDQNTVVTSNGVVWVTWNEVGQIVASGAQVAGLGAVGSFSAPQPAAGSGPLFGNFGDIAIGPNGQVMVTYQSQSGNNQGPQRIFVHVDPDGLGPAGFGPQILATTTNVGGFDFIPAQAFRSVDAEAGLAWDRSGGPRTGRVYLVYADEIGDESNDLDIFVRFSDNDGSTWSAPVRVNDDATSNSQFLQRIALDQTSGEIAVSWYDSRNDTGTGVADSDGRPNTDAQFFATTSTDGGATFQPNVRISTGTSNSARSPSPIDYGDYTGLAFHNGRFFPLWADNSNSTGNNPNGALFFLDLYTAAVTTGGTIQGVVTTSPAFGSTPIPGASIQVQLGALTLGGATTGLNGSYSAGGLPSGSYSVRAVATGFIGRTATAISVAQGSTTIANFALDDDGTRITGTVTRASDGTTVSGATVAASLAGTVVSKAQTAADGTYTLIGLPPSNSYSVLALAPAQGGIRQDNIVVAQGLETTGVNFSLSTDPGAVIGRVSRATNGSGIPGVSVQLRQAGSNVGAPVLSDANGSYIVTGVLSGVYDAVATPPQSSGLVPQTVSNITVNPGQTSVNVNFSLAPATATISGQVVRQTDNFPLAAASLSLRQGTTTIATTTSDGLGNFTFANLPSGSYDISATLSGFVDALQSGVAIVAGQVLQVNVPMVPIQTGGGGTGGVTSTSLLVTSGITLVSIPSNLTDAGVAAFFGTNLRVAKYDPTDPRNVNGYVVSPPFAFNLAAGESYFVRATSDVTLPIVGTVVPTSQNFIRNLPAASPTNPIWTLVGNPFLAPLTWDLNKILYSQNGSAPTTLSTLLGNPNAPVSFYGWKWNASQNAYQLVTDPALFPTATNQIAAGEGLFVLVKGSGVQLIIPASAAASGTRPARTLGQRQTQNSNAGAANGWSFELCARAGEAVSRGSFLGAGADAGRSLQMAAPPRPPVALPYVDIQFVTSARIPLKSDIRTSSALNDSWQFDVITDQSDSDVALSWSNLSRVPSAHLLTLIDMVSGLRRSLRTSTAYVFRSNVSGVTIRRFRIEVSSADTRLRLSGLNVTGNAGRYNLTFQLNRTAQVITRIITASGKIVRTIRQPGARSGLNSILWDGRSESGATLPRGIYLFDVLAVESDGSQSRAVKNATIR